MNTTFKVIIVCIVMGVPLLILLAAWWDMKKNAEQYNEEHDLP